MKQLVWIIDEEWSDYEIENEILKKELPNVVIRHSNYNYESDLEDFGKDADFILSQIYVDIPSSVISKLNKCKGIAVYGGGYDRIDIEAARAKNISVTNVNGYCIEDIAEYVIAAILLKSKDLEGYKKNISQKEWGAQAVHRKIHRITEQTLFIAGCGRIGSYVGQKALALNMNVIGYDPFVDEKTMLKNGITKVSLEEGFRNADFISVHIKCDDTTEGLITDKYFSLMKPTAYLINTSRGKILNEKDLISAIKEKKFAGAILDVITNEPPECEDEILNTSNIMVTPHISYISEESYEELKRRTVYNGLAMYKGERPKDIVN